MLKTVSSISNAIGALNYVGTWNASTNTPALASSVGTKGDYYVVSVDGSTNLNGISNWGVGDWAVFNGSVWQRVEGGANLNGVNLSVSGTSTLSGLTASTALALNASKNVVSVTNTGSGNNVLATSPTLVTPVLGVASATSISVGTETFGNIYAGGGQNTSGITDAFAYFYGTPDGSGYEFARVQGTRDLEDGFTYGSALCFYTEGKHSGATDTSTNKGRFTAAGNFRPETDNTQKLGTAANRWSTVYAGTALINTSDARLKQQARSLNDAEHAVAIKAKSLLKSFKFSDAVALKGDGARIHFGVMAQDLEDAFKSEGLNASDYAMFCYDEWKDIFEDVVEVIKDGDQIVSINKTGEKRLVQAAGNRYGVRYDQLLAFIIAAI